jgi:uncharacterized protein DUF4391
MTEATLYAWPYAARFGRAVPKTKIYEHARVSTRLREQFVSDVRRITWAYKLADETIHLRGTDAVPEIQVFAVSLKGRDLSDEVLAAIDKSIPFPIVFELSRGDPASVLRMVAAYKRLGSAGPRPGPYFTTSWLAADAPRRPLPHALDLLGLYAGLLGPLMPDTPRPGEPLSAATERIEQRRKIEREVAVLEKRMRVEPQLNRKIDLRRQLRDRTATLTDTETPSTEDRPWKS